MKACKNCTNWYKADHQCRKSSPVVDPKACIGASGRGDILGPKTIWPITMPNEWCGDFAEIVIDGPIAVGRHSGTGISNVKSATDELARNSEYLIGAYEALIGGPDETSKAVRRSLYPKITTPMANTGMVFGVSMVEAAGIDIQTGKPVNG